jgi:Circadian oscillating protein COP23
MKMNLKQLLALAVFIQLLNPAVVAVVAAEDTSDTPNQSESKPAPTAFKCVSLVNHPSHSKFATVAILPDGTEGSPLFLWKTKEFSESGYTPEKRCYQVTDRLNKAVVSEGGNLGNLWLTVGKINRLGVLCYVNNTGTGCNNENVLFTFNRSNSKDPSSAIAKLLNISIKGSGNAIQESRSRPYINLGELVKKADPKSDQKVSPPDSSLHSPDH